MKTFKDFILTFSTTEALEDFVKSILGINSSEYEYLEDLTQEDRDNTIYNIYSHAKSTISSRIIIDTSLSNKTFSIVNIVPYKTDIHQLEYEQYNLILDKFYESFMKNLIEHNNKIIKVVYTIGEYSIEEKIPKSYHLLENFAELCNKNSPLSHFSDLNRWRKFICSVVENDERFSSEVIERWFIEEAQFDEDVSIKLAANFEEGRELLIYYKDHYEYR